MNVSTQDFLAGVELDVFLRGSRSYVQGTQLIARASEIVAGSGTRLRQAMFTSITARRVNLCRLEDCPDQAGIGLLQFDTAGVISTYRLMEIPFAARRKDVDMGVRIEPQGITESLTGRYRFEHRGTLEGFLNVLVQSIKSLHENVSPVPRDIWFSGMRGFDLPTIGFQFPQTGLVDILKRRISRKDNQYQSLVEAIVLDEQGNEIGRGLFNFAFKADEIIDVN
jgi:hypothetical protein